MFRGVDVRDRLDGVAMSGVFGVGERLSVHLLCTVVFVLLAVRTKPGVEPEAPVTRGR